jgi:predicted esterase
VVVGAGVGDVLIERGVDYGLGKLADIYRLGRAGPAPLALLWHGIGVDERDVLEPLAIEAARLGVAVVVPAWDSKAPDGGRAHLLASLDFARGLARARPDELATGDDGEFVLAGWSRGGRMAASLALNPETAAGWRPCAVVCLAAGFRRETVMSPVRNGPMADIAGAAGAGAKPVPFHLVHGTRDTKVSIQQSRDFAAAAASHGWPVRLAEPDTDHAGIVMTEWDRSRRRCRPTTEPHAVTAGRLSAQTIAEATRTIAEATRTIADAVRPTADAVRPTADAARPTADAARPTADAARPITDASR